MITLDIEELLANKGMLQQDFLKAHKFKSYMVCDVFTWGELERLALCSGYVSGQPIRVAHREARKPQKDVLVNSVDDAWYSVSNAPLEQVIIEILPNQLYVWRSWDDEFFVVFGCERILGKCVEIPALREAYAYATRERLPEHMKFTEFFRQAGRTYNTLAGTQMEDPEV